MPTKLLFLAMAGAVGTLARYGLAGLVSRPGSAGTFPWGTLTVNVAGCLLAGVVWAFAEHRISVTPDIRTVVLVGFLGGFTTFSAFMLETGNLFRDGQWLWGLSNMALQNVLGFGAFMVGITVGKIL